MARVITFSRTFPSYHPKAGQPTYFVEKIVAGLVANDAKGYDTPLIKSLRDSKLLSISVLNEISSGTYAQYKHHTIRAGHRWKVGDWYHPTVWGDDVNPKSGRKGPYHSKMIKFGPLIQIKKLWDLDIEGYDWFVNGKRESPIIGEGFNSELLAANDGLTGDDLYHWFVDSPDFKKKKAFNGQIICHNENIEY